MSVKKVARWDESHAVCYYKCSLLQVHSAATYQKNVEKDTQGLLGIDAYRTDVLGAKRACDPKLQKKQNCGFTAQTNVQAK